MSVSRIVWIMAGGTGGHIMPGLAVAACLKKAGCDIRWLGNPEKMEGRLVAQPGYPMTAVRFNGVRGKGLTDLLRAPFALLRSLGSLWREASRHRPALVIGMGGYVAMPGGILAFLRRIPLVLHEQNAIAGKTNLWLARWAQLKLEGFPGALPGGRWVGNPVRDVMCHLASPADRYDRREGPLKVLVVGGSLGAAALNDAIPLALSRMPIESRPLVTHQSGERHLQALQTAYREAGVQADCVSFIDDMAQAMAQADLLICRAGAMTVAEVAAVGVAALFVPFPFAVDDHQTANANYLVARDGAYIRQQRDLAVDWLAQWLEATSRAELKSMAIRAHDMAKPQAAQAIADQCLALMEART